jgi:hypothetical protein
MSDDTKSAHVWVMLHETINAHVRFQVQAQHAMTALAHELDQIVLRAELAADAAKSAQPAPLGLGQ